MRGSRLTHVEVKCRRPPTWLISFPLPHSSISSSHMLTGNCASRCWRKQIYISQLKPRPLKTKESAESDVSKKYLYWREEPHLFPHRGPILLLYQPDREVFYLLLSQKICSRRWTTTTREFTTQAWNWILAAPRDKREQGGGPASAGEAQEELSVCSLVCAMWPRRETTRSQPGE